MEEKQLRNYPVVFIGDLNAEPQYECIQKIRSLNLFKNAYDDALFTTFKVRETGEEHRVIDYLFYSDEKLLLLEKNKLPSKEIIGINGLPNEHFSSDHLSLTAHFMFK